MIAVLRRGPYASHAVDAAHPEKVLADVVLGLFGWGLSWRDPARVLQQAVYTSRDVAEQNLRALAALRLNRVEATA